jgi:HPt (histidine-containing phosphotransfer) domain-containing protein
MADTAARGEVEAIARAQPAFRKPFTPEAGGESREDFEAARRGTRWSTRRGEQVEMASNAALSEFIDETLSILDALKVASRAMLAGPVRKDAGERVELGLHTIKGNAAAFEFQDLSATASALLDLVRRKDGKGPILEIGRLMEFAGRAEQYFDRVRTASAAPLLRGDSQGKSPAWRKSAKRRVAQPSTFLPGCREVTGISAKVPAVPRTKAVAIGDDLRKKPHHSPFHCR